MRLFIAVELPETPRNEAAGLLRDLRGAASGVKWVAPEQLHITLKFLGEVDGGAIHNIESAVNRACQGNHPLELELATCGWFPPRKSPQVIWVGLKGDTERLAQLASILDAELAELGFEPENRPFKAHVTLGRVKRRPAKGPVGETAHLKRELLACSDFHGTAFKAERITLMKSTLTPTGAIYEPLFTRTLA